MAAKLEQGKEINAFQEGSNPSLLKAATLQAKNLVISSERLSFPLVPGITIDPKECKDRDDAIYVKRLPEGGYKALITVASVGEFIPEDSPLDILIKQRGFTIYHKGKAIVPMLPAEVSQGTLSLLAGKLRPTLTICVTLDDSARTLNVIPSRTCFESPGDYSYDDALQMLHDPDHKYHHMLTVASELAEKLATARTGRSTKANKKIGIDTVHEIIGEFMILANRVIADYALLHNLPMIFRNCPDSYDDCPSELRRGGAYCSAINRGHKSLVLPGYNRGTSSLRRADDVHNTRVLAAYLAGEEISSYSSSLMQVAHSLTRRERRIAN